jgi:radical SAM protein (TIGR01212 family)
MPQSPRYRRYSDHLRGKFGCRVYKIALDAGLECPNRDGSFGSDGCLFCDPAGGSGRRNERSGRSIPQQMLDGMEGLKKRYKAEKFIAYFQSFSNTYAPVKHLKSLYDQAVKFDDVVGLSIATRPDCLPEPVLDLIQSYQPGYDTWVELGVQSLHEKTLEKISRGHGVAVIEAAIRKLKLRDIQVCAHLILGLPGEDLGDMTATIRGVSELKVEAVKLHMLYVTNHSRLASVYRGEGLPLLSKESYVDTAVHLLEHLDPGILVQRLVSEAHRDILVAPEWLRDKSAVIRAIEQELEIRDTRQGKALQSASPPTE